MDIKPMKEKVMGLTMGTALEIFTNPKDLQIVVGESKQTGLFSTGISRGPRHMFKPLLMSAPTIGSLDDAVDEIEYILTLVHDAVMKDFEDRHSIASQFFNPTSEEIDQSKVLNKELIAKIVKKLHENRVVNTHEMDRE